MWCFTRWTTPLQSSSIVRRSVRQWSDSWMLDQKLSTALSAQRGRAASCLLRRSARWAAGLRTIASTSYMCKERRMKKQAARRWRTNVPPTSPPTRTHRPRTWSWAGLKRAPGCRQGVLRCTPALLQRDNLKSGRSSDGTCKRPAKYANLLYYIRITFFYRNG